MSSLINLDVSHLVYIPIHSHVAVLFIMHTLFFISLMLIFLSCNNSFLVLLLFNLFQYAPFVNLFCHSLMTSIFLDRMIFIFCKPTILLNRTFRSPLSSFLQHIYISTCLYRCLLTLLFFN